MRALHFARYRDRKSPGPANHFRFKLFPMSIASSSASTLLQCEFQYCIWNCQCPPLSRWSGDVESPVLCLALTLRRGL